ncbi:extradiol ring-cleavage dioxygenase [Leptospira hartskeerlii]|uniref:Extradiol ring-cleavage dioxygenase n=1 Tax=Leptospira hartskeerlii TaxID=2023177 RepID=A0A2M9XDE3_9LEPT|nr:VOC family protein [Leptospira hartskeerlii]PJZ25674.1 extradiol ring-cleavage dioxygenase [Leptospira hartskeerlii]PJZ35502.1 extradiol ring-cleavage dioxygenase [Leptospira hartskeerlii]
MFEVGSENLFNSVKLGYVIVESDHLERWLTFGKDAIGLHAEYLSEDMLSFRIDRHIRRFLIKKGNAEDFTSLGFQVKDENSLKSILEILKERRIEVRRGSGIDANLRGVESFWEFLGPKGLRIEIFINPILTETPLNMLSKGFVTEQFGMGHFAMVSKQPEKLIEFWKEIFGARISDYIEQKMSGVTLDITFLRMNPRHHSIAIAATRGLRLDPLSTRIQHLNIEMRNLEDMTNAYQRCKELGFEIAHGIGQHPNDLELSFYVITPSGFEFEVGWNPISVSEIDWKQNKYKQISAWGHEPEISTALSRFNEFRRGFFSLFRSEYIPF